MFERQLPHENLNRAIAEAMRAANMTPGGATALAPQQQVVVTDSPADRTIVATN